MLKGNKTTYLRFQNGENKVKSRRVKQFQKSLLSVSENLAPKNSFPPTPISAQYCTEKVSDERVTIFK